MKTFFNSQRFLLFNVVISAGLLYTTAGAQADEIKGAAEAGKGKVWLCIGCHSIPDYRADYPMVYAVPKLGGQNAGYIASALTEYKKGGRKHPTMRAIATSLSDQDMADISEYYAAQNISATNNPLK